MGREIQKLTEMQCRQAKPKAAPYKLSDGGGLFLLVKPDGGRYWRWSYRFAGLQKTMGLGAYPEVGLAKARQEHVKQRDVLRGGVDPMAERKKGRVEAQSAAEATFEAITREWFKREQANWVESHGDRVLRRFERDVFLHVGKRPIQDITPAEMLAVFKRIQERGAIETAHRAKWDCSQVFRYAIETSRALADPTGQLSRGALIKPVTRSHAAITEPAAFGELLRAIDSYRGGPVVRAALQLAPLVFLRPGELRKAKWTEFDLNAALWEVPGERMKRPKAEKQISGGHLVPLSRQAVEILRELHNLTGSKPHVFPSPRTGERPMSENAVLAALRSMGYDSDTMSGHGFRATARTLAVERLKIPTEWVEMQLAHAVKDSNGRAYNRVQWIAERTEMMQRWADYLDRLKAGAEVVPLSVAA